MSNKALVVDNDFFFVEFLAELLENRGYEVVKAYDGKEGISRLAEGSFDLVFVDIIMPKIDGRQVINFARRKFPDASFPIIAISATLVEQMDDMNQIGADYYLAKGPMEAMGKEVNLLIDKAEKGHLPDEEVGHYLEPKNLYPRQVTRELIESVNFQQGIVQSIGMGIIVLDRDARIMSCNSFALEILNRSSEEVLNQHITSLFPPGDKKGLIGALKNIVEDQGVRKLVFKATILAKEIRIIVSLLRVNGRIAGWILAMEDEEQWVEQA